MSKKKVKKVVKAKKKPRNNPDGVYISYSYVIPKKVHAFLKSEKKDNKRRAADVVLSGLLMYMDAQEKKRKEYIALAVKASGKKTKAEVLKNKSEDHRKTGGMSGPVKKKGNSTPSKAKVKSKAKKGGGKK